MGSLVGHDKCINCVRVSPKGDCIASGGDSGELFLWHPCEPGTRVGNLVREDESSVHWKRGAILTGHSGDVLDLAWSSDGSAILSGSVDNKAFVWVAEGQKRGRIQAQISQHKHFVQGVAWDPALQFIVTQSSDRTARVFSPKVPNSKRNKTNKCELAASDIFRDLVCSCTINQRKMGHETELNGGPHSKRPQHPLFLDEVSLPSFFRRPAWSPDGSFLILPAGVFNNRSRGCGDYTAYLFSRDNWEEPIGHLPAQTKPVVAVRFCPILFRLHERSKSFLPFQKLKYKLIFAVATVDSVILYDTTSALPLAVFGQLHYESITDIAWSHDGQFLAVSSLDCYCSIISFSQGELGDPMPMEELPQHMLKWLRATAKTGTQSEVEIEEQQVETRTANALKAVENTSVNKNLAMNRKRIVPEAINASENISDVPSAGPFTGKRPRGAAAAVQSPVSNAVFQNKSDADSDREYKRITPTPVGCKQYELSERLANIRDPPELSVKSNNVKTNTGHRRITPIPVDDTKLLLPTSQIVPLNMTSSPEHSAGRQ